MCPQRFRKVPFSSVNTYTRKQRFQKVPLWRAFSKSSVFIDRFHRIRVDGSRIRFRLRVVVQSEHFYKTKTPSMSLVFELNKGF